eukprot:SAG11_NODE_1058_length_6003_cov_1.474424_4_plen_492_part_00
MEAFALAQGLGCRLTCATTATDCKTKVDASCADDFASCKITCVGADPSRTAGACEELCQDFCDEEQGAPMICNAWTEFDATTSIWGSSLAGKSIGHLCPSSCGMCLAPDLPNGRPGCDNARDSGEYNVPMEPNMTLSMLKNLWDSGARSEDLGSVHWAGLLMPRKSSYGSAAVSVLHNISAVHAVPTFANAASNALRARKHGGDASVGKITVRSQPFENTVAEQQQDDQFFYILVTLIIMIAFAFVPAAVVTFPVMEAEAHHNSRHQQYISGVSIPAYWISNYVWDLSMYMVLVIISAIALKAFSVDVFTEQHCVNSEVLPLFIMGIAENPSDPHYHDVFVTSADEHGGVKSGLATCEDLAASPNIGCDMDLRTINPGEEGGTLLHGNMGAPEGSLVKKLCPVPCQACGPGPFWAVLTLFVGYGMAIVSVTYLFSFIFKSHTQAQLFMLLLNIVLGLILVLTSYILHLIGIYQQNTSAGEYCYCCNDATSS